MTQDELRENALREVQRLGQEIEQEPVAYWKEHAQGLQRDYDSLLADFQAQRTWVGLTDLQKQVIKFAHSKMGMMIIKYDLDAMLEATEQALKEKNT